MSFELTPIPVNDDILDAVASGSYYSPHSVLGAHLGDDGVTIRVVAHLADAVDIITPTGAYAATHERGGIWVAALPGKEITAYRVSVTYGDVERSGRRSLPLPAHPGRDGHLPHLGGPPRASCGKRLGAHVKTLPRRTGRRQRRTASPCGRPTPSPFESSATSTIGTAACTPCARWARPACGRSSSPASASVPRYKFEIQCPDGSWHQKADPMARATEMPPATASVVTDSRSTSGPTRSGWPNAPRRTPTRPACPSTRSTLGSLASGLGYRELADELVPYVK